MTAINSNTTPGDVVPPWLLEKTFAVQYCPNCPKPWLVRLVGFGSGSLDNKPYQHGQTRDALGFGKTCEEAALAAQAVVDAARAEFQEELARERPQRRAATEMNLATN